MKKIIVACFAALLLVFGGVSSAQADEYLRVGMEAAYAPFNWTQDDNSNGAVPIEGTKQYANGYDVQIAKKIAEAQGKKPLVVKTAWTGLIPALTSGKIDMIIAGMSPTAERRQEIDFSTATTEANLSWLSAQMVIMPTLRASKTSRMLKSQLNKGFISII